MRPVSEKVMALARRRGFLWPSFEVHGKVAGLYDYGPAGTAMKRNVLEVWRRHFVVADGLLEIDTPTITPYEVFEASGHVEKFADLMGRCGSCGAYFKVEGLLGDLSGPEGASWEETAAALADVPCPDCGSTEWTVSEFNLMFSTTIGPDGGRRGFLRPETAQGIFVNFAPLYRLARERMPFGVAQIGRGYRNEISPRQGPIRLREFNMAEIEFFTDPEVGEFPPAERCHDRTLRLVPAGGGERTMTAWEAYTAGIIRSQYLMYFMARTASFLERVGIDHGRMRFRQHEPDEMAHYATDCWDAEVETSYGWIEVVGIADRSAYDLRAHMDHTGRDLTAMRRLPEPVETRVTAVVPVMQELGRRFRADARTIAAALAGIPPDDAHGTLTVMIDGRSVEVPPECYTVEERVEKVAVERFVPRVIEPSFGIDRIIYAVLEHTYSEEEREGEKYRRLSLPPEVAPVKFGMFPLLAREPMTGIARDLEERLRSAGLDVVYDEGGSIGRRYARMDEIGTPFCITVDHNTPVDGAVTIRDRDTRAQDRVPMAGLEERCRRLINGELPVTDGATDGDRAT